MKTEDTGSAVNREALEDLYIEKQKQLVELEKQVYLNDLFAFNTDVLQVESSTDSAGRRVPLRDFHKNLCHFVETNPKRKKLILMPRGHLKSTLVTVGYSLQRIARDPRVRILIANATATMAEAFLGQIKRHLQYNSKFKELFGDMSIGADKWMANMITIPSGEGSYASKEATVTAYGMGGNMVSQHYDMIIVDDPHNRENTGTKDQIEKVKTGYKDLLDLLEPGGQLIVIGTRWHDDDLYGELMNPKNSESKEFDTYFQQALSGARIAIKDGGGYEIEGGVVLWPEKYSLKALTTLLNEKGIYEFNKQYQNVCVDDDNAVFQKKWIGEYDPSSLGHMTKFTAIDPAISLKQRADYTAIVTIGVDVFNKVYILEVKRGHFTEKQMGDELFWTYERFHPQKIVIESIAFQKVLQHYIMEEAKRQHRYLPIQEISPESNESKEKRIRSLQPLYMRGDILHSNSVANIEYLEDELLRFPSGKFDDCADCLAYAVSVSHPPRRSYDDDDSEKKRHYLY
jgi:predicted phage terminase large subunit-like protein